MHATGFLRGYRLLLTTNSRSLTTETMFPLVFCVQKLFPVSLYTLPIHAIRQTKSVCVIERISACALTRTYITCTNTNYVDVPELPLSRMGRSNRNHYLLVLAMRALATSISMYVRTD